MNQFSNRHEVPTSTVRLPQERHANSTNFLINQLVQVAKANPAVESAVNTEVGAAETSITTDTETAVTRENGAAETVAGTEAQSAEHEQAGLSIQPSTVLAHGLNFVLLLVLLHLILYKPLTKLLADREKKIRDGVDNAEKAEVMVNEAGMTKANILKQANVESQSMMDQARKAGETLKNDIVGVAHEEADHIVKAGQKAIEMERAKTLEELQGKATAIVIQATEKILRKKLDQQADAQLIRESIQSYS